MNLPEQLQKAIEAITENFATRDISEARKELSERYRKQKQNFITSEEQRCAYLAARLPATYAAVYHTMQEVQSRAPDSGIKTLLDLGAGPGTAMWAACEVFPLIEQITLMELDQDLASLGKRLASFSEHQSIREALWKPEDLTRPSAYEQHDLVVLSYSIGELPAASIKPLIEACWQATKQFLVIIEPGTPAGFERIRSIRSHLIALGSHLVAPCPHANACPMTGGDWCHFSQRIERSSLHRRLKEGSLGYEDEKFSYVAVSKTFCPLPRGRVLRHPLKRSGHTNVTLCTLEGVKQEVISKRNPELYKLARKWEWGSAVEDN